MAVRGPKAQALAADLADTVTFFAMPGDSRAEIMRLAAEFRARRDLELACHVAVVGDAVAPFMTRPDTDPAALREADSLLVLPSDPTAATEAILGHTYAPRHEVSPLSEALDLGRIGQSDADYIR